MAQWLDVKISAKQQWTAQHYTLRFRAPGYDFKAGQFVRIGLLQDDGEVLARPYSLVNPPGGDELEIYFNVVPEGPLTPQLAALQEGDVLKLSPRPNGFLTLDEVPSADSGRKDLWMLATGTGVGPFLSMLQSEQSWRQFDHLVLAWSVRHASELVYADRIDKLRVERGDQFRYIPAVTREKVSGALSERLTTALQNGMLEQMVGLDITPEASHVMMCGNSEMIRSALDLLKQRGMKKHLRREPGHITTEKYH